MPCTVVGAWPVEACPVCSRCEAARAYGDTTFFFAHCEFFAGAAVALAAGCVAADGAVAWGASARAGIVKSVAAPNAAATPQAPMI
jgi:hypothetical protein